MIKTFENKDTLWLDSVAVLEGLLDVIISEEHTDLDGELLIDTIHFMYSGVLGTIYEFEQQINNNRDTLSYTELSELYALRQYLIQGLINELVRI